MLPRKWEAFQFCIRYREAIITININKESININVQSDKELVCELYDNVIQLKQNKDHTFPLKPLYAN